MDTLDIAYTTVRHEGGGSQRLSVIRGDTDANVSSLESALGDLESGDLRPILYIGQEKPEEGEPGYQQVKDVPTVAELGHPELAESLQAQRVIAAPPDLPQDIRRVLDKAIQDALSDPEFIAKAEKAQLSPDPLGADATTRIVTETLDTFSDYEPALRDAIEGE